MPGPPPKPLKLRILQGNPSKRRLPAGEPEPTIPTQVPDPPPFLVDYASEEWRRTAPELHVLGLLTVADIVPLAQYCEAFMQWRLATEALTRMRNADPVMSGILVKTQDGNPTINPLLRAARQAAHDVLRHAAEFGFTPAARARLAAGINPPPSGGSKFRPGLLA